MNLFGCKFCEKNEAAGGEVECDRKNFDSLLWALVTVFQVQQITTTLTLFCSASFVHAHALNNSLNAHHYDSSDMLKFIAFVRSMLTFFLFMHLLICPTKL